jgi:hypothetical protein
MDGGLWEDFNALLGRPTALLGRTGGDALDCIEFRFESED